MVATVLLLIAPHAALPTAAELNKAAIQDDTLRGLNEGAARFVRPVAQQFPKGSLTNYRFTVGILG
jgi:hypothetical protein